jgi:hypothetical protein
VVSYLHPLHTEDTSTCSQGMVRMTRPRPRLMGRQVADPYAPDRQFSGRAWRDGWRAAAKADGVKLPHEEAAI